MTDYNDLRGRIEAAARRNLSANDSKIMQNAIRQIDDAETLVTEARLGDGHGGNFGVPRTADTLESALTKMDAKGLTPAWERFGGVGR